MTARPDIENLRRRSDAVSRIASLQDLRVREIEAELLAPSSSMRLKPHPLLKPRVERAGEFVVYDFAYEMDVLDVDTKIFFARLVLNLVFNVGCQEPLDEKELNAFGAVGVVEIAHPYVREMVHNLTFRMGLPSFVLGIVPPVSARPAES